MECTPEIVISQMGLLRVLEVLVRDTACVDVGMHCSFVVVVVVVVVLCQRDGSCRGHSAHRSWQGRWNGFVFWRSNRIYSVDGACCTLRIPVPVLAAVI